jgi:hypothetical protein
MLRDTLLSPAHHSVLMLTPGLANRPVSHPRISGVPLCPELMRGFRSRYLAVSGVLACTITCSVSVSPLVSSSIVLVREQA